MSKEAVGQNGAVLGSWAYWERLNQSTFLGGLMSHTSGTDYYSVLQQIGGRASAAIDEIFGDLQNSIQQIEAIAADRRSTLEKQVYGLYNVCEMAGIYGGRCNDCVSILSQSSLAMMGASLMDESAIQSAIEKINDAAYFFSSEILQMLQQAADWDVDFAAGTDLRKKKLLTEMSAAFSYRIFQ